MTDAERPGPHIKIEADKVLHSAPHKLIYLEDDFLKEFHRGINGMDGFARRLLKWVAENS